MENEDILLDSKIEDDVIMIYTQFNTPYNTEAVYSMQYPYISVFIDLVIKKTNLTAEKIGFISDIEGMKHLLSFILYSYDEFNIKKVIEAVVENENI